ncbi:MAG TPA: LysM peptidoglycan-binding domain-containing protein [Acidimicrobiales bacterium]|nr:LysM peptidoglycan-binding domain-containing protein [Acidimicrobiales bacterium]
MAALVHNRSRSDRAWLEPPEHEDARRLRGLGPASAPSTTACRRQEDEQRRRPVLAMLMVVGLLVVGGPVVDTVASVVGASARAESSPSERAIVIEGRAHVVQPGDTYWSIAEAVGGEGDIRAAVDALEEANGGRSLQAGDRLTVPVLHQRPSAGARR